MKCLTVAIAAAAGLTVMAGEVADSAKTLLSQMKPDTIAYQADNGWLYSKNELDHLSAGALTDGRVIEVSKSVKKENANPINAISDFNRDLKALGITLIVMPVPPKSAVYPIGGWQPGEAAQYLQKFEDELRAAGVDVVDLTADFLQNKDKMVYCRTDSHWSPAGLALAADKIAGQIKIKGDSPFTATEKTVKIAGDLLPAAAKDSAAETVKLRVIGGNVISEESPVLILGDSHSLIFSTGGDMLAENAGFAEALAYDLKMPVDRIGIKGSASTPVRVNLYRKAMKNPEWLKNKKFVIWVFTAREFTEAANGWARVPVVKK